MYGGSVGWISRGDAEAPFEEAVFTAPLGKLVRVVTSNGLHLVKVEDERYEALHPFCTCCIVMIVSMNVCCQLYSQLVPHGCVHNDCLAGRQP